MSAKSAVDKRSNVIWVFGDQHRAQALGCNGDGNVHTPNIDNLAAGGVHFNRALSGFPLCCPTRGSLLTGRYPHHCVPGHEHRLPEDQPTIANVFNEEGYETAYFGKWHLDGFQESEGEERTISCLRSAGEASDAGSDMKTTTVRGIAGCTAGRRRSLPLSASGF